MKLILPLLVLAGVSLSPHLPVSEPGPTLCGAKGKPVGRCEPYAEVCRFCTDCSKCGHCAVTKGKCSVCWSK